MKSGPVFDFFLWVKILEGFTKWLVTDGGLKLERKWQILNIVIILAFITEILYGFYQTFFSIVPESGKIGPLFGASKELPYQLLVARRLYAIETWIAIAGLAIYLAIVYRDKLKG